MRRIVLFDRVSALVREQHVGGFILFGGSEPAPSVLLNTAYGTVTDESQTPSHAHRGDAAARPGNCLLSRMVQLGKAIVAGVGAKMLTGSLLGFVVVFFLLYWLLGGSW